MVKEPTDTIRQLIFGLLILLHLIFGMIYILHDITSNKTIKNEIIK